ncbi:hypothetical protein MELB17_00330 [Marinobacter sp. ELB17]|nr:hypothetical protein MELB17_00330 [Marinobacter sp. ELB17]
MTDYVKLSRAGRFDGVSQATCRGGSFRVEWVAGFVWNQWQPWPGIRTWNGLQKMCRSSTKGKWVDLRACSNKQLGNFKRK